MKEINLIDMHTHSSYSDGELSPNELIIQAKKEGIGTLAITDHDTILGIKNISITPKEIGIEIIPGIELSAQVPKGSMHILGYGIDIEDKALNERLEEIHNRNLYAIMAIICQLKKDYDIVFSTEEILEILNLERNIGRPDVARMLIKYGYVSSVKEAFQKYLIEAYNRCGKVTKGIPQQECIELIKNAGGIAVLAHPVTLEKEREELDECVQKLVEYGLDGIEVFHSEHSNQNIKEYMELANKYDLLISGGSDYHGPNTKPDIKLGRGKGNLKIKRLTIVDRINKI